MKATLFLLSLFSCTGLATAVVNTTVDYSRSVTEGPSAGYDFNAVNYHASGEGGTIIVGNATSPLRLDQVNLLFTAESSEAVTRINSWHTASDAAVSGGSSKAQWAVAVENGGVVMDGLGDLGDIKANLSVGTKPGQEGVLTISGGTKLTTSSIYNTIGSIGAKGIVNIDGTGSELNTQQITLGSTNCLTSLSSSVINKKESAYVYATVMTNEERVNLLYKEGGGYVPGESTCGEINITNGAKMTVGKENTNKSNNKIQIANGTITVSGAGSQLLYDTGGTGMLSMEPIMAVSKPEDLENPATSCSSIVVKDGGLFRANMLTAQIGTAMWGAIGRVITSLAAEGAGSVIDITTSTGGLTLAETSSILANPSYFPYYAGKTSSVTSSFIAADGGSLSMSTESKAYVCNGGLEGVSTSAEFIASGEGSVLSLAASGIYLGNTSADETVSFKAENGGRISLNGDVVNKANTSISADNASIALSSYTASSGTTTITLNNNATLVLGTPVSAASPDSSFDGAIFNIDGSSEVKTYGDVSFTDSTFNITIDGSGQPAIVVENDASLTWKMGTQANVINLTLSPELLSGDSKDFEIVIVNGMTNYEDVRGSVKVNHSALIEDGTVGTEQHKEAEDGKNAFVITGSLSDEAVKVAKKAFSAAGTGVANALHTSVSAVQGLGHAALSQLHYRPTADERFWVQGLGDFEKTGAHNSTPGYHYNGGGYAVGYDRAVTEKLVLGAAFGQQFGVNKTRMEEARVRQHATMATLYGRYSYDCPCSDIKRVVDAYASYGNVRNRGRSVLMGERASGRWNDDVFNIGLRMGWQIPLNEQNNWTLTPFIGLEYSHGSQGDAHLVSANYDRMYHDGSMQVWSVPVGATLQGKYAVSGSRYLLPELTLAYVGDISRHTPRVKAHILGEETSYKGVNPGRNAFLLNLGSRYTLTESTTLGLFYSLECRAREVEQNVNASISVSF